MERGSPWREFQPQIETICGFFVFMTVSRMPSTTAPLKMWGGSTGSLPHYKSSTKKEPKKSLHNIYTSLSGAVVLEAVMNNS
ncbi:hypothetical protein KSB_71720 [Ktedonobacter robiniae]|uniref:Uncharacterized protein n=1 Tax=Ktedonobacter robiniae TaxID=2778365 RepID=A0ABQ3V1M5_9CHLR|nr:hypothetical protein KSB_71720 [Ktedonobacter robiniae]